MLLLEGNIFMHMCTIISQIYMLLFLFDISRADRSVEKRKNSTKLDFTHCNVLNMTLVCKVLIYLLCCFS